MNQKRAVFLDVAGIVGSAVLAIVCGFVIILLVSDQPFQAISSFLAGPLSNAFHLSTVINKAIPLVFTGLALAVVFQANVFSMGAEGQLYVGGFAGALAALYVTGIPVWLHVPLILLCAIAGGVLFGAIAGVLKARWDANEVVTTLMLNYVAIIMTSYLVNNVFKDPASGGYARMAFFDRDLLLPKLSGTFPVHAGIFLAVAAVILVYVLLYKTKIGYELRLVGKNDKFARYGGILTKRVVVVSVMISGGLAGLAGIVELLGVHGTYKDNFSVGLGFDGIIIALLARNHPIGVLLSALFYAYLQVGGQIMQAESDVSRELAIIIQVLLVLFVSAQAVFGYLKQRAILRQRKPSGEGKVNADVV